MKRVLLLFTVLLMSLPVAQASEMILEKGKTSRYYARPIKFKERGITFFIFQNGEFDFNTHPRNNYWRRGTNTNYGLRNNSLRHRGVRVEYDYNGRIRRVGNTFINYDYYGRVKRIGRVYMRYRANRLVRVGGKRLIYNRFGRLIRTVGRVKPNHGYSDVNWGNGDYDHDTDWDNDDWNSGGNWNPDGDWDDDDGGVLYLRNKKDEKKEQKNK